MSREYRHIQEYKKEILDMRKQGITNREIGKKFGLSKEQIEQFLKRERRKEEKIVAGIALKRKGTAFAQVQ